MNGVHGLPRDPLRTLIAAAALLAASPCDAGRMSNSFLTVEGEGVSIADDGSVCVDAGATGPITVAARPGWLVNGRESLTISQSESEDLQVTSKLGEDEEHVHKFTSTEDELEHLEDIVLVAEAKPVSHVAMYALPETSVAVTASATKQVVKKGKHRTRIRWTPCKCGAIHDPPEEFGTKEVVPDHYEWESVAAGKTFLSERWSGPMSKGLNQEIRFTVTGKRDVCALCTCTNSVVASADVHELSIERPDYLGLDRTDAGLSGRTVTNATARIDPKPASATYRWTNCGKCQFVGAKNSADVTYGITNSAPASTKFLAEGLTVTAKARNAAGRSASATCTTNFTVVAVDVTIGSVGEDKEEAEGAFVQYVKDANGDISVEGTNKMVEVKFTCKPKLPANEMVTISHTGPGELYEVLQGGELLKVTSATYPACDVSSRTFKLHGHEASSAMLNEKTQATHVNSKSHDLSKCTAVSLDWVKASCDKLPPSGNFGTNPEVFEGECMDFNHPEATPPKCNEPGTQALQVFFKYVKDSATDTVIPFTVKFDAQIRPADFLNNCILTWTQRDGPVQMSLTNINSTHAELENPTATSNVSPSSKHVYKYRLEAKRGGFAVKGEAWVMLPRAGGDITTWLINEVPVAVQRANDWQNEVVVDCMANAAMSYADAIEFVRSTAWRYIASATFDYQGIAGDPTPRYSYVDANSPNPDQNDWNDPSYATLKGIVVSRAKINNLLYCVWGRTLGYSTVNLRLGATVNAWTRLLIGDNASSQAAIQLGGDLYDLFLARSNFSSALTKSRAKELQTEDLPNGLNDVNLWPNEMPANTGFSFPSMPTDYETLKKGIQYERIRRQ